MTADAMCNDRRGDEPLAPAADQFAGLVEDLTNWAGSMPGWAPADEIARRVGAATPRLTAAVAAVSRPLVVGVIGGTGTGKSTLVNALAGRDVTLAGDLMRPTTLRPVVVAAEEASLEGVPLEAIDAEVVRTPSEALAEIVLIDCPDPDTQGRAGGDAAPGNRDRLERILPVCDVLLVVSTAQKYRSFSVAEELALFAPGRPMLFVQTHASRDADIRDDWAAELARQGYAVPNIFRIDGVEACRRGREGLPPSEGFAELTAAIRRELAGRAAARIRRGSGVELVGWLLEQAAGRLEPLEQPTAACAEAVSRETTRLEAVLAEAVTGELGRARPAWRRLVVDELEEQWEGGPFAAFLRGVSMVAGWFRRMPRSATGLVGRVLAGESPGIPAAADSRGDAERGRLDAAIGLDDAEVEQSRSILVGLAARAEIVPPRVGRARLEASADGPVAAVVGRTQAWLTAGIRRLAARRRDRTAHRGVRLLFELLFGMMLAAVVLRAGLDFFYGRLWQGNDSAGGLLTEAAIWLLLWGLALRWAAVAWACRGLEADIATVSDSLRSEDLVAPLLDDFRTAADASVAFIARRDELTTRWRELAGGEPAEEGLGRLRVGQAQVASGSG